MSEDLHTYKDVDQYLQQGGMVAAMIYDIHIVWSSQTNIPVLLCCFLLLCRSIPVLQLMQDTEGIGMAAGFCGAQHNSRDHATKERYKDEDGQCVYLNQEQS